MRVAYGDNHLLQLNETKENARVVTEERDELQSKLQASSHQ